MERSSQSLSDAGWNSDAATRALTRSVESGAASPPIFINRTLRLAVIALVQVSLPAGVAVLLLYGVARLHGQPFDEAMKALAIFVVILALSVLRMPASRGVPQSARSRMKLSGRLLMRWIVVLAILMATAWITEMQHHYARDLIGAWSLATPALILVGYWLLDDQFRRGLIAQGRLRSSVVAGATEPGQQLAERLRRHPELGFRFDGFFDDRRPDRLALPEGVELRGGLSEVSDHVRRAGVEVIFIALPMRHVQRVMEMLDELRDSTVSIYYVPDLFVFDLIQARYSDLMGVPVISLCETPFNGYRSLLKRASDIALTLLILIPALPVMAAIALVIRVSSSGPVIFRQYRDGLDGARIVVYKFRSMYVTENGAYIAQAQRSDPRITPVGRFLRRTSLDELPQLFNVLQGRMSLIGPRPHAVAHNEAYRPRIKGYMVRHKVLPGITGLAQVNGCRGETSDLADMEARIHYDLEYLRRWSPFLDMKILFLTALQVVRGEKAY